MTLKLTPEQREALDRSDGLVRVEDEITRRVYLLVDESTFNTLQQEADLAAIREGITDTEAGRVVPLEEVTARIRSNLGLPDAK